MYWFLFCFVFSKDFVASTPSPLAAVANRILLAHISLHNTSVETVQLHTLVPEKGIKKRIVASFY